MVEKLLIIVSIVLLNIIIILIITPYVCVSKKQTFVPPKIEKPELKGIYVKNPDFIYPVKFGNFAKAIKGEEPGIFLPETPWNGNAYWTSIDCFEENENTSIVVLNNFNERYVEQSIFLPEGGRYTMYIGVINLAGRCRFAAIEKSCPEVKLSIYFIKNGEELRIADISIPNSNEWQHYKTPIRKPLGNLTVKISFKNNEACGNMEQWVGLDYFDIY